MSRLDDLLALRSKIDTEIARERKMQARTEDLLTRVNVALTRGSWPTRAFTATCVHFDVPADDILDGHRDRPTIDARHVAMWLMRDADMSYSAIGRELGADHTTVMNGVRRVEGDERLLAAAHTIRQSLTDLAPGEESNVA